MTSASNFSTGFLPVLFLFLSVHAVGGQEKGVVPWQFKGFVDTYHAFCTREPNDLMSSRARVRGEIGKSSGGSSLYVSFNITYNALLKERTGGELREAYLDHREENWGCRLGRQFVIWGAADGVRVTDLVSPMDMTEFLAQDYDDIRMPVNALRFFVFKDKMQFELLVVPAFEGYRLSTDAANPWSVLPKESLLPLVWNEKGSLPKLRLSNMEYGGRLSFTLPGVDFSLAALHTWNKMPVLTYQSSATKLSVSPHHYRKTLGTIRVTRRSGFQHRKTFQLHTASRILGPKGVQHHKLAGGDGLVRSSRVDCDGPVFFRAYFQERKLYRPVPAQLAPHAQRVEKTIGQHLATFQLHLLRPQPHGLVQPLCSRLCLERPTPPLGWL